MIGRSLCDRKKLHGILNVKEQEFVLRNWSYYELQTKIKYKAEKAGIELIIG